ncbi:hypothetical protein BDP27DRAFT_1311969, partial [Rhodocollybia butyracea]
MFTFRLSALVLIQAIMLVRGLPEPRAEATCTGVQCGIDRVTLEPIYCPTAEYECCGPIVLINGTGYRTICTAPGEVCP